MSHHGPSYASTSTIRPLSAYDDGSMPTAAPAEVIAASQTIQQIKDSLGKLGKTIDVLGEQTIQMIQAGGQTGIANQIGSYESSIRRHMKEQEKIQEEQITEIEELLREVLEHDVLEHITQLIHGGVVEEIDTLVAQQVNILLQRYIPQQLVVELRDQREQLEQVQRSLHNSESRRANAILRVHKINETVHTLFPDKGDIPAQFPRTLADVFGMTGETAVSLVREYGLGEPVVSREGNINKFMQYCGVEYQLISTGAGASIPYRTTAEVAFDRRRDGGF